MIQRLVRQTVLALAALAATAGAALAHPHVWVVMKSELVYAPDGSVTGIRQAWTFDDMYSTFALQGLDSKEKGKFSREELAPLAEVNVTSLKDFDYFTYAKADDKRALFVDPTDYWLDYGNEVLTLHFTLPFKAPVKAKALNVEIYDPSYFVDFAFAEKQAFTLTGAPATCKVSLHKPTDASLGSNAKSLSESAWNANEGYGAVYASKVSILCP